MMFLPIYYYSAYVDWEACVSPSCGLCGDPREDLRKTGGLLVVPWREGLVETGFPDPIPRKEGNTVLILLT